MAVRSPWLSSAASCLVLAGFVFTGASQGLARVAEAGESPSGSDVVDKTVVIAKMLAGGGAEVSEVLRVLGAGTEAPLGGRIHRIDRGTYVGIVEPQQGKRSHLVNQVQIYPQPGLVLRFSALASVLGEWHEIHRGKTSSVRFDFVSARSKGDARIFVQVSSAPERPTAMVLRISIRVPTNQPPSLGNIWRYRHSHDVALVCNTVKQGRMSDSTAG